MEIMPIAWAVIWFAVLGLVLGIVLAIASKIFAVKIDERVEQIQDCLPGANCGGCGYSGCSAFAQAIVDGKAKADACNAADDEAIEKISAVMGVEMGDRIKLRAQVMCSGTAEHAEKKYIYEGAHDCVAAARLGGGDRLCPFGCVGLGTCVEVCRFDAIKVIDGVAWIDPDKCVGCGVCAVSCPKNLIRIIPADSKHWVGCRSKDKGALTRKYCDIGCIGCKLCEKACDAGAITVEDNVAHIDHMKCTNCGKCVEVCKRNIINN